MITKKIEGKEYNFNPLSFAALEELERDTGKSVYKFIQTSTQMSLSEIRTAIYCFSKHAGTVITPDVFQNIFLSEGLNFFTDIVNECIIQILNGKPKVSESDKKKEDGLTN